MARAHWWGYTTNQLKLRPLRPVNDYASAEALCLSVKPLRGESEHAWRPIGHRDRRNIKQMRLAENGDVVFRLYQTELVTWHGDGSFTLRNERPSRSSNVFCDAVTPPCFWLAGEVVCLPPPTSEWSKRACVRATPDRPVRFKEETSLWVPAEPENLVPFEWAELNRAAARRVSAEYRLGEFATWRRAYEALGGKHQQLEVRTHYSDLAELLRSGAFLEAYSSLPHHWGTRAVLDPTALFGQRYEPFEGMSMTAFAKFRAWLYVREGATEVRLQSTCTANEYYSRVRRNRYD